jgi:isoquinoline 1-oxidoreductase beta subunit
MSPGTRETGVGVDRREFLRTTGLAGAGLLIGFNLPGTDEVSTIPADFAPNAYLRIGPDGAVTLFADQVEMGQGVMTALPMIVAEELDADWSKVTVERLQENPSAWPRPIFTVGSGSVRGSWLPLRRAGAEARARLVAAAAKRWSVPGAECQTENSVVTHVPSNRRLTYGELAAEAAALVPAAPAVLKDPANFRLIGTRRLRVDVPSKVNGSAKFGLDVRVPGMAVATIVRPLVSGSRAETFDAAAAKAIPGVIDVLALPTGIAVLAKDTWTALSGRRALKVTWSESPNTAFSSAVIRERFTQLFAESGNVATNRGDAPGVIAASPSPIRCDYELPFAAHAPMEPINCTVHVRDGSAEIWIPTQAPTQAQQLASRMLGLQPASVKVHVMMAGGGFGLRANSEILREALTLGQLLLKTGKSMPVKVMNTREDDMRGGYYRPFGVHRMSGAIDAEGWPVAWSHRIVSQHALGQGDTVAGAANIPYTIPNVFVDSGTGTSPVTVWAWRAVGHSQNGFVKESFLDELAHAGKKDPVDLRRRLLTKDQRALGVLNLAVSRSEWGKPMPPGSGRGIAVHSNVGSHCAQIAEVTVRGNEIHVDRVICAVDCGIVVNPDTVVAQVEGAVIFGLTCALKNEITIAGGKVEQENFNTYPILRMTETPRIEVHLVKSTLQPSGVGELGVPAIAAAVGNAVFAATGKRLRKLPFRLG